MIKELTTKGLAFLGRSSFGRMVINAMAITSSSQGWSTFISGLFKNTSKEKVNNQTALTISTVYATIRNVSEDIAKIPLKLYRKEGASRFEITDDPLARLVSFQPNPDMDAMSFRETLNAHAMGWGNGYAEIQRDLAGKPIALWPLRPDRVKVYREKGTQKVFYRVSTKEGHQVDIWAVDIFHLHGLGYDGLVGYNIIALAAQSIGSAIAMDKFSGAFFGNGMHQSGTLRHPGNLTEKAQERLKSQLESQHQTAEKSHQVLVLEEGMEFKPNSIDPKASQMLETRRFSVTDFCRWMRVPPHKVADLSKSSFSNIEEQNIDYVQDGLTGWLKRWELALWSKLLTPAQQNAGLFFEHSVNGLLRGNIKGRTEAYKTFWDRGIMSINEIRALENLNPIEGGNAHFVPMNFTKLEDAGNNNGQAAGNNSKAGRNAVVNDIAARLASREIKELEKRVKHAADDLPRFKSWLIEFYDKHDQYIIDAILPLNLQFHCKRSIRVDLLSLKLFMKVSDDPVAVLADNKEYHPEFIADNIRSYYEN